MAEHNESLKLKGGERCFLAAALLPGRYGDYEEPLAELAALVDTAGGEVVGRLTQKLNRPHPRTYLGKGKFEELVEALERTKADTVVFDDKLSPRQMSAIEESCQRKVMDRNEVILDIFGSQARSHQAQLQVELAQLQYELPRLIRKWTHLGRLGGGIGTRGPGESQIESDRRMIRRKIAGLRQELDGIERRKVQEVKSRGDNFTACLVGYTNAGKSSLLNRLTGAEALVDDRLFATLDTLTRKLELETGVTILVSDTVGFIRRLPHHLVASFHATLEEAAQADLLLHVVDGADPSAQAQIKAVDATLQELGMGDKDLVYVFNKTDLVRDRAGFEGLCNLFTPALTVSAKTGAGAGELLDLLSQKALAGQYRATLRFSTGDGRRLALINQYGLVQDTRYEDDMVIVTAWLSHKDLERIKCLPGDVVVV